VLKEKLAAEGTEPDTLARLTASTGRPIGAATAEEIALSILAQIVQVSPRGSRIRASSIWITCPIGFGLSFSSILSSSQPVWKGPTSRSNVRKILYVILPEEGSGGAAGFARGGADVTLTEEEGRTTLRYTAKAEIGGKLAQLGSPLVQSTARKLSASFFEKLAATFEVQPAALTQPAGRTCARARSWWVVRDSNPRHLRCKRSALPTELTTRTAECVTHAAVLPQAFTEWAGWWVMRDSNPRHLRCERSALPLS